METRHIKLGYEEALSAKKQLLSSELNVLQTVRNLKNYSLLRKGELSEKNRLGASLSSLKAKINLLQSTLPKEELHSKIGKTSKRRKNLKDKETTEITDELEDIQARLAKLG
jgi:hypothetical protein